MNRMRTPAFVVLAALALPAAAAEPPTPSAEEQAAMEAYQKAAAPGPEHAQLAAMAGTYDMTVRSWYGPGEPATDKGTATRRMILGNRVMVEDVDATMMGQPFHGQGLHGYDNVTRRYWSVWNDSMGTGVMLSDGECDAKGNCTFTGRFNDPVGGAGRTSRMTTRWTDASTEVFEMYGPGPDGKEAKMMEITYRKRGP